MGSLYCRKVTLAAQHFAASSHQTVKLLILCAFILLYLLSIAYLYLINLSIESNFFLVQVPAIHHMYRS